MSSLCPARAGPVLEQTDICQFCFLLRLLFYVTCPSDDLVVGHGVFLDLHTERGAFWAGSHCFNAVGVGPGIWPLLCLTRLRLQRLPGMG